MYGVGSFRGSILSKNLYFPRDFLNFLYVLRYFRRSLLFLWRRRGEGACYRWGLVTGNLPPFYPMENKLSVKIINWHLPWPKVLCLQPAVRKSSVYWFVKKQVSRLRHEFKLTNTCMGVTIINPVSFTNSKASKYNFNIVLVVCAESSLVHLSNCNIL